MRATLHYPKRVVVIEGEQLKLVTRQNCRRDKCEDEGNSLVLDAAMILLCPESQIRRSVRRAQNVHQRLRCSERASTISDFFFRSRSSVAFTFGRTYRVRWSLTAVNWVSESKSWPSASMRKRRGLPLP